MRRNRCGVLLSVLLSVALSVSVAGAGPSTAPATASKGTPELSSLGPLIGSWRQERSGKVTIETWRRVSDVTFDGDSKRVAADDPNRVLFTESMRLVEMEGEIFYLAKVAENPMPVPFKLKTPVASGGPFVFS